MLVKNVINPEKKGRIEGRVFHVLFLGTEAVLFDDLWDSPIIYGNKNIVKAKTKRIAELLPDTVTNVTIFYYHPYSYEMKKRFKYEGPIDKIIVPNY